MNRITKIVFFIIELLLGAALGVLGTYLIIPNQPTFNLDLSILIAFLAFAGFSLIGIGIAGFFHCRVHNEYKNYRIGMTKAALGIFIGLLVGGVVSALSFDMIPYRISSFYIPLFTPILFGVIGFNLGIKNTERLHR